LEYTRKNKKDANCFPFILWNRIGARNYIGEDECESANHRSYEGKTHGSLRFPVNIIVISKLLVKVTIVPAGVINPKFVVDFNVVLGSVIENTSIQFGSSILLGERDCLAVNVCSRSAYHGNGGQYGGCKTFYEAVCLYTINPGQEYELPVRERCPDKIRRLKSTTYLIIFDIDFFPLETVSEVSLVARF
jgi:hypothetical protein